MSSSVPGGTTSAIKITEIGANGIRLLFRDERLFMSYEDFPWFKDQPGMKIRNVREIAVDQLHWPDLDVDLCLDSIRHPEKFPLKARH